MKIALINENSQAAKNSIIETALRKVADTKGYEVVNYGMYSADDKAQLTYVQNGILAATLLNAGACDYVITGCGTGEGAMLALNSFPGVICGHIEHPLDPTPLPRSMTETRSPSRLRSALAGAAKSTSNTFSKNCSANRSAADSRKNVRCRNSAIRKSLTVCAPRHSVRWRTFCATWIQSS